MSKIPDNETRTRLLDAAEELFAKRGFSAVTLRDIGQAMDMHHASLYYYAPGGKEQLFAEVMERSFHRHRSGLTEAIAGAGDDLREQVYAVVHWIVSQPPMDMTRMSEADMHKLKKVDTAQLMALAYDSVRIPIVEMLVAAGDQVHIAAAEYDLAAMGLVSLLQSVHSIPYMNSVKTREAVGRKLADMFLDGLLRR